MDFSVSMKIWESILTLKPKEAIEKIIAVKNPTFMDGLTLYIIASLISATVTFISMALVGGTALGSLEAGLGGGLMFLLVIPLGLVGSIIMAFLMTTIANALGGKGNFNSLYYAIATISVPATVATIVGIIPCVGSIIILLIEIYVIYLEVLAISKIFALDTFKSIVAWIVPVIITMIFFGALIATAIGGLAMMQ